MARVVFGGSGVRPRREPELGPRRKGRPGPCMLSYEMIIEPNDMLGRWLYLQNEIANHS